MVDFFVIIFYPIFRTALETIEKLSSTLDFTDYSSQIIHAVVDILETCPDLYPTAMEVLCCMMVQLGSRYKIFIPMVKKAMVQHKHSHPTYELYLCRLLKVWMHTYRDTHIMQELLWE